MKTRFKIYLAVLALVILFGVVLNSVISDEVPPTSAFTPTELEQFRLENPKPIKRRTP